MLISHENKLSFLLFTLALTMTNISLIPLTSYADTANLKVRLSVKPLDLTGIPTAHELMAAGQLGGQLYPTEDIQVPTSSAAAQSASLSVSEQHNLAFGIAIEEWNRHNYKAAVEMFKKYSEDYPDSPWVSEAKLHVGCDARYNGRYTEAEEMFTWIINNNKDNPYLGAKMLLNKARSRLAVLKVIQANFIDANKYFTDLVQESPDWRHRTYASHWIQRISRYKKNEMALLSCGTRALARVMEYDGHVAKAREVLEIVPPSLKGHSLGALKSIAKRFGYTVEGLKLSAGDLPHVSLPALMQINPKNKGDRGHYWVMEEYESTGITLYDAQSRRRFKQSIKEFLKEWDGNALVFSNDSNHSGIVLAENEMKSTYGACCGIPSPEGDLGDPKSDAGSDGCGAPVWRVNMVNLNLYATDTPLWYNPPVGPPVRLKLSYNSQSAIAGNEPFGNKWTLNYGSYLVIDTAGVVTVFMPDGRRDVYYPDGQGGYLKPLGVFNTLTKIAENHFNLDLLDGTVYEYNIPPGTSSLQPFLVKISDAYGQALTFGYNSTTVMLETITDALGKTSNLVDTDADGLIDRVDGPFGRSAHFLYDANRNLTKITDMGGYWTELGYDTDVYLSQMTDATGQTDFYIEPSDGLSGGGPYPTFGSNMWQNYRITVTDPSGGKEEFYYYGPTGEFSWHVSPNDYVEYISSTENNSYQAAKTYYYLTHADYGEIKAIKSPEGVQTSYVYDSLTGKPATISDYTSSIQYSYNGNGLVTSFEDSKGNITTYEYYPNNSDIWKIKYNLRSTPEDDDILLKTFTYNGSTHDVSTVTDRLGYITEYTYNALGQLDAVIRAKGTPVELTTDMVYDAATHELKEIRKDGTPTQTFTYDNVGRVKTHTDDKGLTITYWEYSDLNKPTKVTYPDTVFNGGVPSSKYESITYSACCPHLIDSVMDRAGLTTTYAYDTLKRLRKVSAPTAVTEYDYDRNGNMSKLIDANSNTTIFSYNLDNKISGKTYHDGRTIGYKYYPDGYLKKITNARDMTITYSYDSNKNVTNINYSDGTPDVTLTYDDFNRLDTMTDGIGLYDYGYDDVSRLQTQDGPWPNDTVTFQYNALHDMTVMTAQGGQSVSYFYDYDTAYSDLDTGRLKEIIIGGTGTYTYNYSGINPAIQKLTRPNGSFTDYLYNDPLKRMTEISNKNSAQAVINSHTFTYNDLDVVDTETITTGTALDSFTAELKTYDYNSLNQLLSATNPAESFMYDDDGNMNRGYTPDGYQFTAVYDAESRLQSISYNDGAIDHETKYYYSGDSMLARLEKYENSALVSETRFIRVGFLAVQERDGNNTTVREYTNGLNKGGGIGGLLNLKQGGADYTYFYDGKGNVMAILDNNEAVQASYRYDSFGNLLKKAGTFDQPMQFSTKRYDQQTGLSSYGYRFYNSSTGRWMTRDPIGEAGGINLYGFVGNNPVNFVDPLGLLFVHHHFRITFWASMDSDNGVWDSANLAWDVMWQDENAFDTDASATAFHAMIGEGSNGYQSPEEAMNATNNVVMNGCLPSALHAGQDLPIHNFESMQYYSGWNKVKHFFRDVFPGDDIKNQAYNKTRNILDNRSGK